MEFHDEPIVLNRRNDRLAQIQKERAIKAKARSLQLTWKNPRFYVILFTIFPFALPIALVIAILKGIAKGIEWSVEWFEDHWQDLMQPVREWIERGAN